MNAITLLFCLSLIIAITSCSPKHNKSTPDEPVKSKPAGVLTDAQEKTLNRAKEVDTVLQDANEKRLKQIDEMNK